MPLVSIIIPAYCAERYIDAALDSARAQTHRDLEIIVVDDASADATAERISVHAAADPRVRPFRLSKNSGQCAALNHGLGQARGKFIKFFDADDVIAPEFITVQLAALAAKPRHLAYGSWGRFTEKTTEAAFTPHPGWHDSDNSIDWILETWGDTEPMYQCALFLIPRTLLEEVGGWNEQLNLINDFEFFTRLVLASDGIRFTSEARLYYRSGLTSSLSQQRTRIAWRSASLSTILATEHALKAEDSPRTRSACANMLQALVYEMYPNCPDIIVKLEQRVANLGGSDITPKGGNSFTMIRRLIGWKSARHLQIATGKYPRPSA